LQATSRNPFGVSAEACDAADEALEALVKTVPTTLAGIKAVLEYVSVVNIAIEDDWSDCFKANLLESIARAVAAMCDQSGEFNRRRFLVAD
jgi:hypothetical protein